MLRKITYIAIAAVLLLLATAGVLCYSCFAPAFNIDEDTYLYIYPDDDINVVNSRIEEYLNPKTPLSFMYLAKAAKKEQSIKSGRYKATPDMNMLTLLRNVCNHRQEPVNLVVPTVRTVGDLAGRICSKLMADSAIVAQMLSDSAYCASLGYNRENIPALFIPNTYQVYWDISEESLLERLKKENSIFWNEERKGKAAAMNMTPEEVTTLASIVDSETANNTEKARIAGLYMNRLASGMPLQSDPTVIFALGDFSIRRVMHNHLRIDSPYNTYRYKGLPPGPIRIASIAGIDAVLNHETHNYIYMCAKEDFSGTHNYAATYREHQANARRYTKALNERGIK